VLERQHRDAHVLQPLHFRLGHDPCALACHRRSGALVDPHRSPVRRAGLPGGPRGDEGAEQQGEPRRTDAFHPIEGQPVRKVGIAGLGVGGGRRDERAGLHIWDRQRGPPGINAGVFLRRGWRRSGVAEQRELFGVFRQRLRRIERTTGAGAWTTSHNELPPLRRYGGHGRGGQPLILR
jgi:hypothetical protein